ncbi:M48 family metallopeptidase [Bartonella sp. CB175]|uniref:M48 family metallopeptidase n=1 Tax=Bartonella sp. CB175 TaxID=3112256 RepID=UPI00300E05C9
MLTYEQQFICSNYVIPLRIRKHKRARNFVLRIDAIRQRICVTTPPSASFCSVQGFIEKHRSWIEERFTRIKICHENFYVKEGTIIPLLGVEHTVMHKEGRGVTEIIADDARQEPKIIVYGSLEYLPRRVASILKKQAALIITPLVAYYAHKVGRKVRSICYKDTKSRWGSCSKDGRISFSWRLVMAPREVLEYVVAHEVAHLIEMNHGPKFWDLCEKLFPNSKKYRAWLKENGHILHAINFDSHKLEI